MSRRRGAPNFRQKAAFDNFGGHQREQFHQGGYFDPREPQPTAYDDEEYYWQQREVAYQQLYEDSYPQHEGSYRRLLEGDYHETPGFYEDRRRPEHLTSHEYYDELDPGYRHAGLETARHHPRNYYGELEPRAGRLDPNMGHDYYEDHPAAPYDGQPSPYDGQPTPYDARRHPLDYPDEQQQPERYFQRAPDRGRAANVARRGGRGGGDQRQPQPSHEWRQQPIPGHQQRGGGRGRGGAQSFATIASTTRGAPATRGASATRGSATRGSATRGSATRGSATRGSATRGSATRGSATRGSATRAPVTAHQPPSRSAQQKPKRPSPPDGKKSGTGQSQADWGTVDEGKDSAWVTLDNWESKDGTPDDALEGLVEFEEENGWQWMEETSRPAAGFTEELDLFETWVQSSGGKAAALAEEAPPLVSTTRPETSTTRQDEPSTSGCPLASPGKAHHKREKAPPLVSTTRPETSTTRQDEPSTSRRPLTSAGKAHHKWKEAAAQDEAQVTSSQPPSTSVDTATTTAKGGEESKTGDQPATPGDPATGGGDPSDPAATPVLPPPQPLEELIASLGDMVTVDIVNGLWECHICKVYLNSEAQARGHFRGARHQRKVKRKQLLDTILPPSLSSSAEHATSGQVLDTIEGYECTDTYCSLCPGLFPGAIQAMEHYRGKKHTSKKAALYKPKVILKAVKAAPPLEDVHYPTASELTCVKCSIVCNSIKQYNQHMISSRHTGAASAREKTWKRKGNYMPGKFYPKKQQKIATDPVSYSKSFVKAKSNFNNDSWNQSSTAYF